MENTVNNRIELLRTHLKLSQQEFASSIGMSQTGVWKLETGASKPRRSTIVNIAVTFNANTEWLTSGKGEMMLEATTTEQKPSNSWKDEAYEQLQRRADELQAQVSFLRSALSKQMGLEGNFNNAFGLVGFLESQKSVGSVSLSNVA